MIRSSWKHSHIYFKLLNFFNGLRMTEKKAKARSKKMKKQEVRLTFHIRNRTSVLELDKELFRKLAHYKFYVYNGLHYALLSLDRHVVGSKLGEFIFTKLRGSGIHGIAPEQFVKRASKSRIKTYKKFRKPRRLMGFNSHRARIRREIRYNRK